MRILLLLAALVVFTLAGIGIATAQDMGAPDSAYFLSPRFVPDGCTSNMAVTIPLYLASDDNNYLVQFSFQWLGEAMCDTVVIRPPWLRDASVIQVSIDRLNHTCTVGVANYSENVPPSAGVFADLSFHVELGSAVTLDFFDPGLELTNPFYYWYPTYQSLDTTFTAPDSVPAIAGDADGSGGVDIDDVVYLINYIFGGGCPPWHLNSGDPDGSCAIDIDDVVYLISYIFSGGYCEPGCLE